MSEALPRKQAEKRDPRPLLTVKEVAKYLKLTPETVRAMARDGKLPSYKIGRVWRFSRQEVEERIKF